MSDYQIEDSVPKGNEWEVVALTESTYAASPSPIEEGTSDSGVVGVKNPETGQAMFMSGHFGSPSKPENVPQELDLTVASPKVEQTSKLGSKNEEDINMERLISDEFPGEKKIIEKVDNISFYSSDFGDDVMCSKLIDKEQGMFDTGKSGSFSDEAKAGMSLVDEDSVITEPIESLDRSDDSEISDMPKRIEERDFNDISHDTWWRKHALSLYAHAKNVNPVWSIVVAAAVVGLVIVGYRWQRDRQQVMQLKPRLVVSDEGSRWMTGPVTRLKDITTLSAQTSPYIRVLSAAEH